MITEGEYTVRLNVRQEVFNDLIVRQHLKEGDYDLLKVFKKSEEYPDNPEWVQLKEEIKQAGLSKVYKRLEEIEYEERNK